MSGQEKKGEKKEEGTELVNEKEEQLESLGCMNLGVWRIFDWCVCYLADVSTILMFLKKKKKSIDILLAK